MFEYSFTLHIYIFTYNDSSDPVTKGGGGGGGGNQNWIQWFTSPTVQYICTNFPMQSMKTIQFCFFTCFTSLNALSKLSLIAKLLFSMSPRKFLRDRKLLSTKKVDKALRASTISYGITTDLARLSQFFSTKKMQVVITMLLPCHCRA